MKEAIRKAKEKFLEYPLITARQLAKESGASIEEIRELFSQFRIDDEVQKNLKSWGPAQGYCIFVLQQYILDTPEFIECIYHDELVYPKGLELHLGPACPCACIFCYSKGESSLWSECANYRPGPNATLLNSDEVLSIVNKLVDKGCSFIYFSGGLEPFASKVTIDVLYRLPKEPNVHIFTNGVPDTLSDDVLKFAVQRASRIRFSVHAASPRTYSVVQMPHRPDGEAVFQHVISRIKKAVMFRDRLRDSGKPAAKIGVTFLTVPPNYTELEDAVQTWVEIGIDRFDIGNDALGENSRTEVLNEEQKEELRNIHKRIEEMSNSGELKGMKVRPSRESVQAILPAAQKCYAPLEKAVIDPYGNLWTCCMRAHPFLQSGNFHLGLVRSGEDFQKLVEHRHHQPPVFRNVPLGFHCRECTEYEYVANIWIQKLIEDLEFGIAITDQPFKV